MQLLIFGKICESLSQNFWGEAVTAGGTSKLAEKPFSPDRALALSAALFLAGFCFLVCSILYWAGKGFGELDPGFALRLGVPAVTLMCLGLQGILGTFVLLFVRSEVHGSGKRSASAEEILQQAC